MTEEWDEIRGKFSADPGGPAPSLFLEQTEARRTENLFFWDRPPTSSKDLDDRAPSLSQGLDPVLILDLVRSAVYREQQQNWNSMESPWNGKKCKEITINLDKETR